MSRHPEAMLRTPLLSVIYLDTLNLSRLDVHHEQFSALAQVVSGLTKLERLCLDGNKLSRVGMQALGAAAEKNLKQRQGSRDPCSTSKGGYCA